MGIWPKYADGTDINALDVCNEQGIVATADDSGFLNILNFPSVVEEAPRRMYSGHSSFVQNVRFLPPPVQSGSGLEQRSVSLQLPSSCPSSCIACEACGHYICISHCQQYSIPPNRKATSTAHDVTETSAEKWQLYDMARVGSNASLKHRH